MGEADMVAVTSNLNSSVKRPKVILVRRGVKIMMDKCCGQMKMSLWSCDKNG